MGGMPALFLLVFRFVRLLLSGHQAVAIENAALSECSVIAVVRQPKLGGDENVRPADCTSADAFTDLAFVEIRGGRVDE